MNASVQLLHRCIPAAVGLRTTVPEVHRSVAILGAERAGTATVLDRLEDGTCLLVTAHYVVLGADAVVATLAGGTEREARCAGVDFTTGLALIEIDDVEEGAVAALPVRRSADPVRPGEDAFLLSRSSGGTHASDGIVTSVGPFDAFWEYTLEDALTLSALHPGPGGGPIIDVRGRMIGLAALSLAEVGRFTLGIPGRLCQEALESARATGALPAARPRAWLGLVCYPFAEHVVVASLMPGSPAEAAGLLGGDVLVAVDGVAVGDRPSLYRAIWKHAPGEVLRIEVLREGGVRRLHVMAGSAESFFA